MANPAILKMSHSEMGFNTALLDDEDGGTDEPLNPQIMALITKRTRKQNHAT